MKVSGEFLIFLLLLITNARVFFVESRKDSIVMLSPLAFILSIFQIASWGLDLFTGACFLLSLLVLFSNFHALYRYFERLYVDHYTPVMYVWAVGTSLICIFCIAMLWYFRPSEAFFRRELTQKESDVSMRFKRYTGSFSRGFEKSRLFQKTNLLFTVISPAENEGEIAVPDESSLPLIVFFPDKRAETYNYLPYLMELAKKGYTVVSTDFYAKDCRWLYNPLDGKSFRRFGLIIESLRNPFKFNSQKEFYAYNSSLECKAVFDILTEKSSNGRESGGNPLLLGNLKPETKYILASDFMANIALSDFQKSHENEIAGLFFLDELESYKTPGYGFVSQTDPLMARILGLERDDSKTSARLCAEKSVEAFRKAGGGN